MELTKPRRAILTNGFHLYPQQLEIGILSDPSSWSLSLLHPVCASAICQMEVLKLDNQDRGLR